MNMTLFVRQKWLCIFLLQQTLLAWKVLIKKELNRLNRDDSIHYYMGCYVFIWVTNYIYLLIPVVLHYILLSAFVFYNKGSYIFLISMNRNQLHALKRTPRFTLLNCHKWKHFCIKMVGGIFQILSSWKIKL